MSNNQLQFVSFSVMFRGVEMSPQQQTGVQQVSQQSPEALTTLRVIKFTHELAHVHLMSALSHECKLRPRPSALTPTK